MEDENGLELSLGLSFGVSSVKPKSQNGGTSDARAEDARNGKMADDFKSMFDDAPQKPDSVDDAQRIDFSKPEENFFKNLSKAKENASLNLSGRGFRVASSKKPVQIEDDKLLDTGIKRKMSFDDINNQKKRESEVHHANLHKTKTSHVSKPEDGLAAEKEDVVYSEAENSTARPISQYGEGTKQFIRVGVSSESQKDVCGIADTSATDFNGEKKFTVSTEKDFKLANLTYGASFSLQQVNMINAPAPYPSPAKESNSVHAPNPQISGVMHMMPTATGELSGYQSVSNGSLPVMFGNSSIQLPMLDKDNTWSLVSCSQQPHPAFAGRDPSNAAAIHAIANNMAMPYEGRPLERSKGDDKHSKQRVTEESSFSQSQVMKGSISNLRAKNASEQSIGEGSSVDFSFIKPGLAADVKFSGAGSCPNLPWVSTSGSGPNGMTISGVTYRLNTNQIRIVCACHGSHMTPEDFVRHANEDHVQGHGEGNAVLGTVANGNSAASATANN